MLRVDAKFIQLMSVGDSLFALDESGQVWRHYPLENRGDEKPRFAFWGKITNHRARDLPARDVATNQGAKDVR